MATNSSPKDHFARVFAGLSAAAAVVAVFIACSDAETSREAVRQASAAVEQAQKANRIANDANDLADGANELADDANDVAGKALEQAEVANEYASKGNNIAEGFADREKQEYARDFQVDNLDSTVEIRGGPDSGGVTDVQLAVFHWKADGSEPVRDFTNADQIDVWTTQRFESCQSSTVSVPPPLTSRLYVLRFTDKAGVQWYRLHGALFESPQEEFEALLADKRGPEQPLPLQELDVPGCAD